MNAGKSPSVSIIVPAFNEEGIISTCIEELFKVMRAANYCTEVVVVNDGSTDQTLMKAKFNLKTYPYLRVLSFRRHHGKATALREGIRAARGDIVALFDADLQYDPSDLVMLLDVLNKGPDIVTGKRDFLRYQRTRAVFSTIYNRLLRLIFRLDVSDSNCGMKVLRRKTSNMDFLFRFGTALMMPLLKLRGYRIAEREVSLRQRKVGQSKFFDDRSFLGGWKHIKAVSYHSGMLLCLLASLPSEWSRSRVH